MITNRRQCPIKLCVLEHKISKLDHSDPRDSVVRVDIKQRVALIYFDFWMIKVYLVGDFIRIQVDVKHIGWHSSNGIWNS